VEFSERYMRRRSSPTSERSFSVLIFSGVLDRFPDLQIVSAENNCGWLPYYLQRMDRAFDRGRYAAGFNLKLKPSEYFQRQMYCTYIDDYVGVANRHFIGVDKLMWSSDYPHRHRPGPTRRRWWRATSRTPVLTTGSRSPAATWPGSTTSCSRLVQIGRRSARGARPPHLHLHAPRGGQGRGRRDLLRSPRRDLGIVGESGSGKSMTCLSILRLVPEPGGRIVGGRSSRREDLLAKSPEEMRRLRGAQIAMILQDPMASLNPAMTVGEQIAETLSLSNPNTNPQTREGEGGGRKKGERIASPRSARPPSSPVSEAIGPGDHRDLRASEAPHLSGLLARRPSPSKTTSPPTIRPAGSGTNLRIERHVNRLAGARLADDPQGSPAANGEGRAVHGLDHPGGACRCKVRRSSTSSRGRQLERA